MSQAIAMPAGRRAKPGAISAEQLRRGLKALQLRQVDLAEQLGVSPHTVKRWVHGTQPVPQYVALVIYLLSQNQAAEADPLQSP